MAASPLQLVLVTGLSGAGKSTAARALEDGGFYCIDNLPTALLPALVREVREGRLAEDRGLALVMDGRDPVFPREFTAIHAQLAATGRRLTILYLEAGDAVIFRRFSEMRRRHPVAAAGLRQGVEEERRQLGPVRAAADHVIDTSGLTPHELREHVLALTAADRDMHLTILSFGFKHGPPVEADLVFDVRFLPNPHFDHDLRPMTGLEPPVASYALDNEDGREFFSRLAPLVSFLIPRYRREGKRYLTIGIGCTGGRHRSVAVTERLAVVLREQGEQVLTCHRDLESGA